MRRLRPLLVAALLAVASAAHAQDFHVSPYSNSVYKEGPGFALGSSPLVIHPGFAAELGYDSNVFYNPVATGTGIMRLRAHLDIATQPPQAFENDHSVELRKVEFRFSTQVEYREYLSPEPAVQAQRAVELLADAGLVALPSGPFTLTLGDTYARTADPRNYETMLNYTRDYNRALLTAAYRSAGGLLEVGAGDTFSVSYWESGPGYGNSLNEEGQLYFNWKMMLRSTLSGRVRVGWVDYQNNTSMNSIPFRAVAGFSTLLASWFGLSVTAGYGNSFNATGPSYNNFVGGAEVRFMLPYQSVITLHYDRDFYDSLFANFFVDDHLALIYEQPLFGRLAARLEGGVRFRHYEGLTNPSVIGSAAYSSMVRDDIIYSLRAELMVRATSWLAFNAGYNLLADSTDFAFIDAMGMANRVNYIKHSVLGRIDIAY